MPELPELHAAARVVNRFCCYGGGEENDRRVFSTISMPNPPAEGAEAANLKLLRKWLLLVLNSRSNDGCCADETCRGLLMHRCKTTVVEPTFTIHADRRGKELRLTLSPTAAVPLQPPCNLCGSSTAARQQQQQQQRRSPKPLLVTFRMGLVGKFIMGSAQHVQKTVAENQKKQNSRSSGVKLTFESGGFQLAFVDTLDYGSIHVGCDFDCKKRSPDPTQEYEDFRRNILDNLAHSAFNRPICEALLDQRFFNGIGNYLRAEILHRAGIPPFANARTVLAKVVLKNTSNDKRGGSRPITSFFAAASSHRRHDAATPPPPADSDNAAATIDVLQLCRDLPLEVIAIKSAAAAKSREEEEAAFDAWKRCYGKAPHREVDANKRTIWYFGESGKLQEKHHNKRPRSPTAVDGNCKRRQTAAAAQEKSPEIHVYPPTSSEEHCQLQAYLVGCDARLERLFAEVGPLNFQALMAPPMVAVVSAVIGQQITYSKARQIRGRLYAFLGGKTYSAAQLLAVTDEQWAEWGLRAHRVQTVRAVAQLQTWDDTDVDWHQVTVTSGIGPWSLVAAKLQCTREANLFPSKDRFLERNIRRLIGCSSSVAPAEWRLSGYCSYIAWYLWRWF